MNQVEVRPLTVEDLKRYKANNPVKFKQKYGELNLDAIDDTFPLTVYKMQVVQERARREKYGLSQDVPTINPEFFAPKVVETRAVEPVLNAQKEGEVVADTTEPTQPSGADTNVGGGDNK